MDIYEKSKRIYEIREELETIDQTLGVIRILQGTVNARTTERCIVIISKLIDRVEALANEAHKIREDIENQF